MALKVEIQGNIPALEITYLQFKKFSMSVATHEPYQVSVSATVCLYGKDSDGVHHYSGEDQSISLSDVMAFVAGLPQEDQAECAAGIQKINEGLGILAEKTLGIGFVAYEA